MKKIIKLTENDLYNIVNKVINETLSPSEFRPLMKIGRELAMERIGEIWPRLEAMSDFKNRSGDRLYYYIQQSNDLDIPSKNEITNFLSKNNYDVVDFAKGLVKKKDDKNIIKLGKILTMLGKNDKTALDLLQKYSQQKSLETNTDAEYLMVISRHQYDIGGMATDRHWTSCMDLRERAHRGYVEIDISQGSLISYLVHKNDKNIKNPISRILIKPYLNKKKSEVLYGTELDNIKYGLSNQNYFKKLIYLLDTAQQEKTGIFTLDEKLYKDGKEIISKFNPEQLKELKNKFKKQVIELRDELTFEKITNEFAWLLRNNVSFNNAVLGVNKNNELVWYDGIWFNGTWEKGEWINGVWENGIWKRGVWRDGTWKNGICKFGDWKNGTWHNGTWHNGSWSNGVWYDGIWENGFWETGLWKKGTWNNGGWNNGTWLTGNWYNGTWYEGTWHNGTWHNGTWLTGNWYNGNWKQGLIFNKKKYEMYMSSEPPE